MTEKDKPTIASLVRRVDVLEEALERMLAAFKEDLGAIREDLLRLEGGPPPRTQAGSTARPSASQHRARPSGSGARPAISEELSTNAKKRDPRSDE